MDFVLECHDFLICLIIIWKFCGNGMFVWWKTPIFIVPHHELSWIELRVGQFPKKTTEGNFADIQLNHV